MGEAIRRARLARAFAETLASDAPLYSLWPRCAATLAELARASGVTIVLHRGDRSTVAYRHEPGDSAGTDRLSIPIRRSACVLGSIDLAGAACGDEQLALLDACAFALAVRLDRDTVPHDGERMARLAFTDALTGIPNRRSFETALTRAWSSAGRHQTPLAIVMFEIDDFGGYAARRGAAAANDCLQRAAKALDGCIGRPSDLVARYGEATFVALLLNTASSGAAELAERMRDAATDAAGTPVSAGAAARVPDRRLVPGDLLCEARAALDEVRVR
jgi:diguanylate cyclase (GGDEF)-like protein